MCMETFIKVIVIYGYNCIFVQLAETKSHDNSTNLLDYLIHEAEDRWPDVLQFTRELEHVEEASKGKHFGILYFSLA